jgi:hypothetical protein
MARIYTNWEKSKPLPISGLEIWATADSSDSLTTAYDLSGNSRNLISSDEWERSSDNALYNDGTFQPLQWSGTPFLAKHLFLIIAIEGSVFSAADGVLTGLTDRPFLVGVNAANKFADNGLGANFQYKKSDVSFANSNLTAPMGGAFAIIEIVIPDGIACPDIQIGRDRANAGTIFNGSFLEVIAYSLRKGFQSRRKIYSYLAEKYSLWRETADGLPIFPFPNNLAAPFRTIPNIVRSAPLPNGTFKERRKGQLLDSFDFSFSVRKETEINSAREFERQVFGVKTFALENFSMYPPRRINCRMLSGIAKDPQGLNTFNYQFSAQQTSAQEVVLEVDLDEIPDSEPPTFTLGELSSTSSTVTVNYSAADNIGIAGVELEIDLVE